jgi:tetratricopeptide (TPR) repeat protein
VPVLTDNGGAFMRPRLRSVLPLTLVLALGLGYAAPARADDDAAAQARAHYQKANSYYEAAYELKNDPAFLYNLAQSNRLAGNSEQALRFYKTYLRKAPKGPFRAETEAFIAQLEPIVAQKGPGATTTPPTTTPPPATSEPPSTAPPVTTPPPAATTSPPAATAPPGAPPAVPPSPPEMPPTMPEAPTPPGLVMQPAAPATANHHSMILTGEITAAAGVGIFIVGAAYGGLAVGAANTVNDAAKSGQAYDPSVQTRGKNDEKAEIVLMTVGAVAAATGAVLFFYGRHLDAQERASIAPMASSSGGGVSLRVTF